jgi:monofunctional biosynthetic peptidoglycan transglycosylase
MVISVEDYKFYKHWGFDMEAFERAMQYNKALGRPMYGGSTLTMQTARTLFLVPFKSYIRKYMELIITLELELILSKNRILELYLSWAEWGRGVFGIDAASRKYFGVSVGRLSVEQAARIVALLSSPVRFMPWTLERSRILNARYIFLLDAFSQK